MRGWARKALLATNPNLVRSKTINTCLAVLTITPSLGAAVPALAFTCTGSSGTGTGNCGTGAAVATTAAPANDFLNSLGVHLFRPHLGAANAAYAAMLNYLGVRNFRPGGGFGSDARALIDLAQSTKTKAVWWLYSTNGMTTSSLASSLAGPRAMAAAGVLGALEGPNEPDNWRIRYNGVIGGGSVSWLPVAQFQRDAYAAIQADPVLRNYPVFNLTHSGVEKDDVGLQFLTVPAGSGSAMPAGTAYADYANMHNYVIWDGAPTPVDNSAWNSADPVQKLYPAQYPFKDDYGTTWRYHYAGYSDTQRSDVPRVTTETGWVSSNGGEEAQARVLLNVYLANFKRGYKYTYLFQLRDSDGAVPPATDTFGLFHSDNTAKPIATYIHNLTAILADATSNAPESLDYSIPSEPPTMHDLLLQKSDGVFELVVWDERPIGEATDNVSVNLGGTHATVRVYDVTVGTDRAPTFSNVGSVPLSLTDHPLIVEVAD